MLLILWQRFIHSLKSNGFKQCIQKCYLFMVNSAGLVRKSKVLADKLFSFFGPTNFAGNVLISGFFLFRLKSFGKVYQLEANHLREGIITRRYSRKMSQASDKFVSEAGEKLATGRYTAQKLLQIISHVTEKPFKKMAEGKKIRKKLKMTCPL